MDKSYFFFFNCLLRCCPLSQLTAVSYGHFLSPPPFSLSSCFFPFIVNISITLPRFRSATRVILTTICIYSENQSVAQKDKFHPSLVGIKSFFPSLLVSCFDQERQRKCVFQPAFKCRSFFPLSISEDVTNARVIQEESRK